jgi:hypothetical protein
MDDSERSYGYSQDIYHGRRGAGGHYDRTREEGGGTASPEESYEYGGEGNELTNPEEVEVSPEEAAVHLDEQGLSRTGGDETEGERYDHDRVGTADEVESFTWGSSTAPEDTRKGDKTR